MANSIDTSAIKATINPGSTTSSQSTKGSGFSDLIKGAGLDAIDTSKAADEATKAAVAGEISDLELVQVMNEAELSLQRFKSVYETTKQSLDKILSMNI